MPYKRRTAIIQRPDLLCAVSQWGLELWRLVCAAVVTKLPWSIIVAPCVRLIHVGRRTEDEILRPTRRYGDRALGAALRVERRAARRLRGSDRRNRALGGLVPRLVRARRGPRGARARGPRARVQAHRRRAPGARVDVLPLRQVRFRARSEADARRAPALARLLSGGASAYAPGGRARRDTVRGQDALWNPAAAGGRDGTLADIDHGAGPGFHQGGAARLCRAVSRARDRDPRDRRARAGRGGVRDPDLRRLRARRARGVRLDRGARRSGCGQDRHVGREPRRLL